MQSSREALTRNVAIANRILADTGLATGATCTFGHASARLPEDASSFVIKGRGYAVDALATMRPQDMIVCNLEGYKTAGPAGIQPPNEVKMHSCIYKRNPKVQAVVHVHPRYTVLLSILGKSLVPMCVEGMNLVRSPLPVYPHVRLITNDEHGGELAALLGESKAALLFGHGAVTAGASLEEAVTAMIDLEEQSKMNWYAYCAEGKTHPRIPEEKLQEFDRVMKAMSSLDHLRDTSASADASAPRQAPRAGAWSYYASLAAKDMEG